MDRRQYSKLVAGLLRDIGVVKCQLGDMAAGCQLLNESVGLYQWLPRSAQIQLSIPEVIKIAEVWYHLGSNFLSDDLRQDSLLEHVMRMTKTELSTSGEKSDDEDDEAEVTTDDVGAGILDVEDSEDSYSVCTHEAVLCYQRALHVLDRSTQTGRLRDHNIPPDLAELYAGIYTRLADCYVLTKQLDRAVVTYERTLPYFQLAATSGTNERRRPMLALNAHALSMLATVNFLLHHYWRASAIYETSLVLHHQMSSGNGNNTLESAWIKSMYGLTFAALGRDHQCVLWCLRAFAGYVAVLRGRILDVEPLRRWFIVETLYIMGKAYSTLDDGSYKALHYLTVARNLATAAPEDQMDYPQTIEVLDSLSDVCELVTDPESSHRYKTEADRLAATLYGSSHSLDTSNPIHDPKRPPESAPSRETPSTQRESAVSRHSAGARAFPSAEAAGDGAVGEMMSRLGLRQTRTPDVAEESVLIRQAERDLDDTVSKTGGAAMTVLGQSASPDLEGPADEAQRRSSRPSSASRYYQSSLTVSVASDYQKMSPNRSVHASPSRDEVISPILQTSTFNFQATLRQNDDVYSQLNSSFASDADKQTDLVNNQLFSGPLDRSKAIRPQDTALFTAQYRRNSDLTKADSGTGDSTWNHGSNLEPEKSEMEEEEWIIVEEVVETPAEILSMIRNKATV